MNDVRDHEGQRVAEVVNAGGAADILLICEHASHFIPPHLNDLGLEADARTSHAAWDPGAARVACVLAERLDAPLVMSCISRLVCDCNRPPHAHDTMPARSEVIEVPGNRNISAADRADRIARYHAPFHALLARTLAQKPEAAVVTVHSFTPIYKGEPRAVEIGVLHDADSRLADSLLETAAEYTGHNVQRNAPYGPQDGVMHTLQTHALPDKRRNVMLEVRNDLIATPDAQQTMAETLSAWISAALARTEGLAWSR